MFACDGGDVTTRELVICRLPQTLTGIIIESVSSRGAALRTALQIYHSRVFQKTANTALRTALYLSGGDSITRRATLCQGVCHFCLVGKL